MGRDVRLASSLPLRQILTISMAPSNQHTSTLSQTYILTHLSALQLRIAFDISSPKRSHKTKTPSVCYFIYFIFHFFLLPKACLGSRHQRFPRCQWLRGSQAIAPLSFSAIVPCMPYVLNVWFHSNRWRFSRNRDFRNPGTQAIFSQASFLGGGVRITGTGRE